jgi:uncharacterized RDD family membrane protein YckC
MSSADKLTIETPEQTAIEFPLAGIGSRFLAIAIDLLLRVAFLTVLGIIVGLFGLGGMLSNMRWQWTIAALIIAYFFLETGYFAFFEVIWNGQTPGKRWTHLRVIKDSGRAVGVPDAILRNLMRIIDYLPSFYGVGVVTILISGENKRLGDYAAGTVVVHEKPMQGAGFLWAGTSGQSSGQTQPQAVSQLPLLTLDELQSVEAFLERRASLDYDVRRSMAWQIAERIGEPRSVPPEARPDSEQFLEALAEQRRQSARFR